MNTKKTVSVRGLDGWFRPNKYISSPGINNNFIGAKVKYTLN